MHAGRHMLRTCALLKLLRLHCGACRGIDYLMPATKLRPPCHAQLAARDPVSQVCHRRHWCRAPHQQAAPAGVNHALMLLCPRSPSPSPPAVEPTLAPTPGSQGASQPVSTFRAVAPAQPGVCTVQYLQVSHCTSQPAQDAQSPSPFFEQAVQGGVIPSSSTVLGLVTRHGIAVTGSR